MLKKKRSLDDIKRQGLVTRGQLYETVRDCLMNTKYNTYENVKLLQQFIDAVMELPACWPDGSTMKQTIKLDADLVAKREIINKMEHITHTEDNPLDRMTIYSMLQQRIFEM